MAIIIVIMTNLILIVFTIYIYGGWTSLLHASVLLFIKLSRALAS